MIEVCPKNKCFGCGACINSCTHHAIDWIEDEEGFRYPTIDQDKCVDCGVCALKCPIIYNYEIESFTKEVYAAFSYRWQRQGSSGGVFSALAQSFLPEGYVYGAAYHDNLQLYQTKVHNLNDLPRLQGSKYSQSESYLSYNEVKKDLIAGKRVFYCGTPCQIAGLLNFIPTNLRSNLFTADFICHGVPSQRAFDRVVETLQERYGKATDFVFRLKDCHAISPYIVIKGKAHFLRGDAYSYMNAFYQGYLFRPSCYTCQFSSLKRPSDITLADFWGIKDFDSNRKYNGVSLIIVNTIKGRQMFEAIKDDLYYEVRTMDLAMSLQKNLNEPSQRPTQRDTSALDILNLSMHDFGKKYKLLPQNIVIDELKFIVKMLTLKLGVFKYLNKK